MEVEARRATAVDLPVLEDMASAALAELRPLRGGELYVLHEARRRPLPALLDDARALVAVGTVDDAGVGYAVGRVEELLDGSRLAVIDDLYVDPGAREVGVGEALMDALVEWARERSCRGIDAVALPGSRETKNFFETFGLTARAIIVHRDLEDR